MKEVASLMSSESSLVLSALVWTLTLVPSLSFSALLRSLSETPGAGGHGDRVQPALLVEQPLRGRDVEQADGRPAERVDLAVLDDAGDGERLLRALRGHADLVARLELLLVGRALVDRQLAIAARVAAGRDRERVEALDARSRRRCRAWARSRLPMVLPSDPTRRTWSVPKPLASTVPVASPTWSTSRTLLEQGVGDGGGPAHRVLDLVLGGDDRVGARVRGGEDGVERLVDGVREDVGAADHRDAEDDGEGGQQRAAATQPQALERDASHALLTSSRDDLAVLEVQDAVGDRGGARVVRDHHGRLAEAVDRRAQQVEDLLRWWWCRGCRSARRRTGRWGGTRAPAPPRRAAAGRPRARSGRCPMRSWSPTRSISSASHASSTSAPEISDGSRMFSRAVSIGSRLKNWKMKPMCSRRSSVRPLSSRPVTSTPAIEHVPPCGLVEPREHVHERRLAGPARAHHGGQLAGRDVEIDAAQRVHGRLAFSVDAGQSACSHHWGGHGADALTPANGPLCGKPPKGGSRLRAGPPG